MQISPLRWPVAAPPSSLGAKKTLLAPIVATVALLGTLVLGNGIAQATDYNASATGAHGIPLGQALAAATNYGDRVFVYADGTYTQSPMTVARGVQVIGVASDAGSKPVIQPGTNSGATLDEASDIINYVNGTDLVLYPSNVGGLIGLFNVTNGAGNIFSNLNIKGRRFENLNQKIAAGIIIRGNSGGQTQVSNCTFDDIQGAAVFMDGGSNYDFVDNTFNNSGYAENADNGNPAAPRANDGAGSSGDISFKNSTGVKIRRNTFYSESSFSPGRGYRCGYGILGVGGDFEASEGNYFNLATTQPYLGGTPNFDIEWEGFASIHNNSFGTTVSAINTSGVGKIYDNDFRERGSFTYGIEANGNSMIIDRNTFHGDAVFVKTSAATPNALTITRNIVDAGCFLTVNNKVTDLNVLHNTVKLRGQEINGGGPSIQSAFMRVSGNDSNDWEIKNNIIVAPSGNNSPFLQINDRRDYTNTIVSSAGIPTNFAAVNNIYGNINFGGPYAVNSGNINSANPNLDGSNVPLGSPSLNGGVDIRGNLSTDYGYFNQDQFPFNYVGNPDIGAKESGSTGGGGGGGGTTTASYYRIRCRWIYNGQPADYLYDGGELANFGALTSGSDALYQWEVIVTDNGSTRFKNRSTGDVINIENIAQNNDDGKLRCTVGDNGGNGISGWYSSRWNRQATDSGFERFESNWQGGKFIHIENRQGNAQYGGIQSTWQSAQWTLEAVTGSDADSPTNLNAN